MSNDETAAPDQKTLRLKMTELKGANRELFKAIIARVTEIVGEAFVKSNRLSTTSLSDQGPVTKEIAEKTGDPEGAKKIAKDYKMTIARSKRIDTQLAAPMISPAAANNIEKEVQAGEAIYVSEEMKASQEQEWESLAKELDAVEAMVEQNMADARQRFLDTGVMDYALEAEDIHELFRIVNRDKVPYISVLNEWKRHRRAKELKMFDLKVLRPKIGAKTNLKKTRDEIAALREKVYRDYVPEKQTA